MYIVASNSFLYEQNKESAGREAYDPNMAER